MKKSILALGAMIALGASSAGAVTPLWLRDVKISPNGETIAFTYKGDIYTVPVNGGKASRLTDAAAYESTPIWSPDGKQIAYASDRKGGLDIYIMDADGGNQKRLTSNSAKETPESFTPDGKYVVFSAAIQDVPSSMLFPSGRLTELYQVPVGGGATTQILPTPAQMMSYLGDGSGSFVYQDQKGMENEWRKHHTSSVTRDIWLYDAATKSHKNLTTHAGEDRNPVTAPNGEIYFLSERGSEPGASINVYSMNLSNPGQVKQVTDFKTHPVRFLSRGSNGKLAFGYNGEIYTMTPGQTPEKVVIDVIGNEPEEIATMSITPKGGTPSPDGKQVAFVNRGNVFVTSVEYPTTKVITTTPEAEASVTWGDNRTLYYASERDGASRIYKATIARKDEPNFPNATIIDEVALTPKDGVERTSPDVSPDGKKIAYFTDRNLLTVMDIASGKETKIAGTELQPGHEGYGFVWSPDSRYIAAEVIDRQHDPYTDIAIIDTETGKVTNFTQSGYVDTNPRWVMNGDAVLFATERYGMRNQASWGSMMDVMIAFTNQEAYDRFRLSEEDYALLKEQEKNAKKDEKSDDKDGKKNKKDKKKASTEKPKAKEYDFAGMEDRIVRLTPFSSDLGDAYVTKDGDKLYFMATFDDGNDLWVKDLRKGEVKLANKMGTTAVSLQPDREEANLFILGSSLKKMNLSNEKITPIKVSGSYKLDKEKEREYMYDYVVREEREKFYDKGMHGVDWAGLTENYRRFLPHINNNQDFSNMLSELLGELNVSHTGSGYYAPGANDKTADLGLLYDWTYAGPGLKVLEVVQGSPFDRSKTQMTPGAVITAINQEAITAETDMAQLFNNLAGKKTLVTFTIPSGKSIDEVVKPISSGTLSNLLYKRWVRRNEQMVDSLSNGRLGYVHIAEMNDASFRPLYANVLGKYNDRDGIVIDTRWNGGGRMHEDIEVMFSGKKYLDQVIRGNESCVMPSRRWTKPSIMLTSEANYSNAHGTPWVYQTMGLGKVVGAPVPGTMTSVNWVTLQDPSVYFGIPVIGYRTAQGNYLENTQLEPDIKVLNTPERITQGIDDQVRTAVTELLREIDAKK